MQGIRARKQEKRVEMQGIRLEIWGIYGIMVGIWGMGMDMQGIKIEMRGNCSKNKGVETKIVIQGVERGIKTIGNVFAYNYISCKFFHESGSFTFLAKDLFWQIQGFNGQNCKIHIPK